MLGESYSLQGRPHLVNAWSLGTFVDHVTGEVDIHMFTQFDEITFPVLASVSTIWADHLK